MYNNINLGRDKGYEGNWRLLWQVTLEQRYEGSESLATLEKSILGSGETKGKSPYKRTR